MLYIWRGHATHRELASSAADPLISDPYARPLVDAVGVDYYVRLAQGDLVADGAAEPLDPHVIADGMAIRTRYFDDFFLTAIDAGIRQAVILASGLDARAYRSPWPAGMTVFELDQPAVIEFKGRARSPTWARRRPRNCMPSVSICATTGRPLCAPAASTRRPRPRGSPKDCSATCRPTPRIACSTKSPR